MAKAQWEQVPIESIYLGLYDGPHATPKPAEDGPVFLGIKNLTEDGHLDLSEIRHISEEDFPKWTRRVQPQSGDIVFTYEATLNRYAIIPEGFRGCLGRRLALIRPNPKRVDMRYLLSYFFSKEWQRTITSNMILGSTVDRIPLITFPKFKVHLPPLPIQHKIADILSAYDNLIENNQRRIAILEEMARSLYHEWFVKFHFPGHEQVEMVESKLGRIPEGWDVANLEDVAGVNLLSVKNGNEPEEIHYVDIASVSTGQIDHVETMPFSQAPGRARRIVKHGDIIWSTVRPNRKSYSIILSPPENMIVSTGFAVISAQTIPYTYLYLALTTDSFASYLTNHATGSAYPAVNTKDFQKAFVLLPPENLLMKFHRMVGSILSQEQNFFRKNSNLRRTRDLLLPKLISGELDVSSWVKGEVGDDEAAAEMVTAVAASKSMREPQKAEPIDVNTLTKHSLWE